MGLIAAAPVLNGVSKTINGNSPTTQNASKQWSLTNRGQYHRFEARPGDVWPNDQSSGNVSERSEYSAPAEYPFGTDIWLSMAMRIPNGSGLPSVWMVIGQFHSTNSPDPGDLTGGLSPPWAQQLRPDGDLEVVTRANASSPVLSNPGSVQRYRTAFPRDQWVRLVHRLQFARTGNGYMQMWKNGVEVVNTAIPMGYNQTNGPYFKFGAIGIYGIRPPSSNTPTSK
jgi:hypothetical protein